MFNQENKKRIEAIEREISDLQDILEVVGSDIKRLNERRLLADEIGGRVAELEVKMSKLWNMLTETTATGKEKLSRFGRKFGGMSKRNNL